MKLPSPIVILLSTGNSFCSSPALSTNTWTFIYLNSTSLITFDIYKKHYAN